MIYLKNYMNRLASGSILIFLWGFQNVIIFFMGRDSLFDGASVFYNILTRFSYVSLICGVYLSVSAVHDVLKPVEKPVGAPKPQWPLPELSFTEPNPKYIDKDVYKFYLSPPEIYVLVLGLILHAVCVATCCHFVRIYVNPDISFYAPAGCFGIGIGGFFLWVSSMWFEAVSEKGIPLLTLKVPWRSFLLESFTGIATSGIANIVTFFEGITIACLSLLCFSMLPFDEDLSMVQQVCLTTFPFLALFFGVDSTYQAAKTGIQKGKKALRVYLDINRVFNLTVLSHLLKLNREVYDIHVRPVQNRLDKVVKGKMSEFELGLYDYMMLSNAEEKPFPLILASWDPDSFGWEDNRIDDGAEIDGTAESHLPVPGGSADETTQSEGATGPETTDDEQGATSDEGARGAGAVASEESGEGGPLTRMRVSRMAEIGVQQGESSRSETPGRVRRRSQRELTRRRDIQSEESLRRPSLRSATPRSSSRRGER